MIKLRGQAQPAKSRLSKFRREIDISDRMLIKLFAKRFKISDQIGRLKKKSGIAVVQKNRWLNILADRIIRGKKSGLSEEFIAKIFKLIHAESIRIQRKNNGK